MLELILLFPFLYKLIMEEREQILLKSNLLNALIIELIRKEKFNDVDTSAEKPNRKLASTNKEIEDSLIIDRIKSDKGYINNNLIREDNGAILEGNGESTNNTIQSSRPSNIKLKPYSRFKETIDLRIKGTSVDMLIRDGNSITGERILNFKEFITIKSQNITVWVNPESIDAAY